MTRAADLLAVYDDRLRGGAEVGAAAWSEQRGPLWLARFGTHGLATYRSLDGLDARALDALVAAAASAFARTGRVTEWEWKTLAHDDVPRLEERLVAAGLVPQEVETVMLGAASDLAVPVPLPGGLEVRRVDTGPDRATWLTRAAALQREVFGVGPTDDEVVARFERMQGLGGMWVAAAGEQVVGAGRIEIVPGTACAGLWGGCTRPGWRGSGAYRALVAARAAWCLTEGVDYLHSDCTTMSRPILERSGLVAVTTSTPYRADLPSGAR